MGAGAAVWHPWGDVVLGRASWGSQKGGSSRKKFPPKAG